MRFKELRDGGQVVRNLMTIGLVVTWALASVGAIVILGLPWRLGVLLGAILVVTGPTVIDPLVRHIKPRAPIGSVLRWEGIVIDPVGALLAVLVFEFILAGALTEAALGLVRAILLTIVVGGGLGLIAAWMLVQLLRRYWVPDRLSNPVSLMLVLATFVGADLVQAECHGAPAHVVAKGAGALAGAAAAPMLGRPLVHAAEDMDFVEQGQHAPPRVRLVRPFR